MIKLLFIEFSKLLRLTSLRFSLLVLAIYPFLWAYAPGVFKAYGTYVVSAFQVPAFSLLSTMQYLLPLLVAIASAELLGLEMRHGTLATILLRPVTRSGLLLSKIIVAVTYPFLLLAFLFIVSLIAGIPLGFSDFVGGTGVGPSGLVGEGTMTAASAMLELIRAYFIAGVTLVPISLLSILFTVLFMNVASGALATITVLFLMELLVVFPWLEPYLLSSQLNGYFFSGVTLGRAFALIAVYSAVFAGAAMLVFERKDY